MIGVLAFCVLVLSFYKKDAATILAYQTTASLIYALHYFLLGGLSGAFISTISAIRNIAFIKYKNKIVVPIFIVACLSVTIVFYESIYSVFPFLANSCYFTFVLFNSKKYLLLGEIISGLFWIAYSIFVLSYSGMITESILMVSNTILLMRLRQKSS